MTTDHTEVLGELGRDGNFSLIPSLRKKYKHRRAELVRFGCALYTLQRIRDEIEILGERLCMLGCCIKWHLPQRGGGAMEAEEEAVRR